MSPAARGWCDAMVGTALFFALSALCDGSTAATTHRNTQETIMPACHSEGPYNAVPASVNGYTLINDKEGRAIGAALTGANHRDIIGLPKDIVEANGRLFAASSTLFVAVKDYIEGVELALQYDAFTPEILETLTAARANAEAAFAIMDGSAS